MKLLIGCPIYKRSWILPTWIKCIISQSVDMSNIGLVFEAAPDDESTIASLEAWKKYDKRIPYFNINIREDIPHFEHSENGRQWTVSRYENMTSLRNSLLSKVREVEPDYYFSLDSDILIENTSTLELLIAHIVDGADAVSPLMFMTPHNILYPSVMSWRSQQDTMAYREERYPLGTYFQSDVIMAAKMMSKKTYTEVDYSIHNQGEDVGWSLNCREKNLKLFSASYIYAPHIMNKIMYNMFMQNGDEREHLLRNYIKA